MADEQIIINKSDGEKLEAVVKLADRINAREREKLLTAATQSNEVFRHNARAKASGVNNVGHGAAKWRQVAEIPEPVYRFLVAIHGEEFIKSKEFLKQYPEWATVNPWEA